MKIQSGGEHFDLKRYIAFTQPRLSIFIRKLNKIQLGKNE